MSTFRIFVVKKNEFAAESKKLKTNLENVLQIKTINSLKIFNLYDIEGISNETFKLAIDGVFCEPQVDDFFLQCPSNFNFMFACALLPGQFDVRANFCEKCLQLINNKEHAKVKTAKVFCFSGNLSLNEMFKIKTYLINPVECEEFNLQSSVNFDYEINSNNFVEILSNFNSLNETELKQFSIKNNLAMDLNDLKFCQHYFKNVEKRPPTIVEIKVIDTYWSDHCRHTTFLTTLKKIQIDDEHVQKVFDYYLKIKKQLNLANKPINLMDLATIAAKKLKNDGFLNQLDESDEINACSVNVQLETQNGVEDWLLVFKNETHNHPTEIEPFGGAATCIGGAIRDPLSARAYVFHAMRITGCASPLKPFNETLKGKLPQSKIALASAEGYSSYGNQVGVATGFVEEIYHSSYEAKHLEIGAVIGGVAKKNVVKLKPQPGDVVLILGGKTGRDGCEGASGSSKIQTQNSIKICGAQVQKGNPVEERKLQRFFKNEKISKLIKRCNDFGAGGICVAIGELADGVNVNLNAVLKKYDGLSALELAISESQERMAIVISEQNLNFVLEQAKLENLLATKVATIKNDDYLTLNYCNKAVVNLKREFLNSNGVEKIANVKTNVQKLSLNFNFINNEKGWLEFFSRLNICSQKGLVEMFDCSIGGGCVLMPYGGKFQTTKAQAMAFLFPTKTKCKTASVMAYGFNPFFMEQSPFYGAQFSVIESLAKIVAVGGNFEKCYLTFQEYFPNLGNDENLWGLPFLALLGAFEAQVKLKVASIGGKDSMSGTFEKLNVVSTLVCFAVCVAKHEELISPEFKKVGSDVALILPVYDNGFKPNFESVFTTFKLVENLIKQKVVLAAYAINKGGVAEAVVKMCFGNRIGFSFCNDFDEVFLNKAFYGGFVLELTYEFKNKNDILQQFKSSQIYFSKIIGKTTSTYFLNLNNLKISLQKIESASTTTLEPIYSSKILNSNKKIVKTISCFDFVEKKWPLVKTTVVKVLVPIFPGTNCEFDIINKFEQAGAVCEPFIINCLNSKLIIESVKNFAKKIKTCQIIALPGGFSAGDEPDGSAKFIVAFFKNEIIKNEVNNFLKFKDGLMIGICNGFQALIKLGLIEFGEINSLNKNCSTLTYNEIGKHQSKIVNSRVCCVKSPWLWQTKVGDVFKVPISHSEGRFIATNSALNKLIQNNQIATQYVNFNNEASMDIEFNPNGSFLAVEGLTSPDGRVFGKMGHSERVNEGLFKNVPHVKTQQIFKAGVDYFRKI